MPGVASAQSRPGDSLRLNAYGILRGGGGWEINGNNGRDMETGGGLGVRLEIPIGDYVAVGPLFEYAKIRTEDIGGFISVSFTDFHTLVFGAWVKGRYVFDVGGYDMEIYLGMPIGLTAYLPTADGADNDVGVSVGLMGGAEFFFTESLGVLLEMGFRRDGYRDDFDGDGDRDKLRIMQFAMNMGLAVAF